MSDELQGGVCTRNSCDVPPTTEPLSRVGIQLATLTVEVVSDAICPWCFIGKRRLEKAVALLRSGVAVHIRWRPFQLNPGMPKAGMDRRVYRSQKFGS